MGPISRVSVISVYDALAEVPVLGTITSAVRLSQNICIVAFNVLESPFIKDKTNLRDNIRFAGVEISLSLREIAPLIGNIYTCKLNKKTDLIIKTNSLEGVDLTHFSLKGLYALLNSRASPFYKNFALRRYIIETEKKLKKERNAQKKILKEVEAVQNVIVSLGDNEQKHEKIEEVEQLIKETK